MSRRRRRGGGGGGGALMLPLVIDQRFKERPDVFLMGVDTPGVGGDVNRWPAEVLEPSTHGIKYILFNIGVDYRNRTDHVRPPGNLYPVEGGSEADPVFWIAYDAKAPVFRPKLDHSAERAAKAAFNFVEFSHLGIDGRDAKYIHVHGLSFSNQLNMHSTGCTIEACEWYNVQTNCIRFRFNATDNIVTDCYLHRLAPFDTTQDVVAILFGQEGINVNNTITGCTILNYTDQVQTIDRNDLTTGSCPGLVISNNTMGFTPDMHLPDGSMLEGLENVIDFKAGGTKDNPVTVRNNIIFGTRPNSRTPGYAVVFHNLAEYFVFVNNTITDHDAGISLIGQWVDRDTSKSWVTPKVQLLDNLFLNIKDNGAPFNFSETGCVFSQSNPVDLFLRNEFKLCRKLFERAMSPLANQPWPFDPAKSNIAYEPFSEGAISWPEAVRGKDAIKEVQVRYTSFKVVTDVGR